MAIGHFGVEALALVGPTAQGGHVGLRPSLVDEDEPPWIKPALILLPLRASPGDLWPELFGRKHAFFEAQTPGMRKAPDLHIVQLQPTLRYLGNKTAQGEVGLHAFDQPVAMRARKDVRLVAADLARRDAARLALTANPHNRAAYRHAKPRSSGSCRNAIPLDCQNQPFAQIRR